MYASPMKAVSCVVALVGCIQFVVLTIIAMLAYPGGMHPAIPSTGYNFFENFFSDLGGTATPTGLQNPASSVLFFIALFAIGALTVPFLLVLPSIFKNDKVPSILAWFGSIIGIISAIAFVGVAFTPWNVFLLEHILFVQVAFIGLIPLAFFYLVAVALAKHVVLPRKYIAILIEFLAASICYIALLFTGPGLDTPAGLIINATGQKLIVYNSIIVIASLAYGTLGVMRNAVPPLPNRTV
jgi:hypothetical protein